jgi:hypothetical protein
METSFSNIKGIFKANTDIVNKAIADVKAEEWFRTPEEMFSKPSPDGLPSFDKKISGAVAFFAFHDAYHTGQLSFLRKWLGYGQTVG